VPAYFFFFSQIAEFFGVLEPGILAYGLSPSGDEAAFAELLPSCAEPSPSCESARFNASSKR
jgi:hypothetical protein